MTRDEIVSVSAAFLRADLMFEQLEKHKEDILKLYPGFANGDTRANDAWQIKVEVLV